MAGGGAPQLGGVRRLVERQRVNINAQKLLTLPLREEYVWREGYRRVCTRPLRGRFGMGESIRRKRVVLFVLAVVVVLAGAGVASANTVYPPVSSEQPLAQPVAAGPTNVGAVLAPSRQRGARRPKRPGAAGTARLG